MAARDTRPCYPHTCNGARASRSATNYGRDLALTACFQPLQCKLADRLQHSETDFVLCWGKLPHQAPVDEPLELGQNVGTTVASHRLRRFQCEAAGEDSQTPEQQLLADI